MFGIGMSEMIIILAVALLVFGPQKLPEIARGLAKGLRELRRAGDDLRASVDFEGDGPHHQPARRSPPKVDAALSEPPARIPGSELASGSEQPVAATSDAPVASERAPWPQAADGTQAVGSLEAEMAAERAAAVEPEAPEAPPGEVKGS